jgi:hypothetical protein
MSISYRISRLAFTSAVAVLLAACSDLVEPPPVTVAPQLSAAQAADVFAVQNRHTPGLMLRDGILGTGVRMADFGPSIVVYALSPAHAAAARLPGALEGYPLEIVVTGRIDAGDINDATSKERPAPNGFSVGHPDITAGTLGARVKDGNGNIFILSNNHVLANTNKARLGDPILQPGAYDGGTLADQIGTLYAFEQIEMGGADNVMDAAIALVSGADLLGATPAYAYGAPGTTVVAPALGQALQKFGRTTGLTKGTVQEVNVTVSVCFVPRGIFMCAEAATFTNQFSVGPGSFSAGGDSGSLIVTDNTGNSPVGLLFAGNSTRTFANPIGPVLARFGVSIDPGSGSGGSDDDPPPPGEDTTKPVASFTYSCGNTANCSFTDTSTDNVGVTGWSWTFEGGTPDASPQQNPSTTFGSAGSKLVVLTVVDAKGNSGKAERTINCAFRGQRLRCS